MQLRLCAAGGLEQAVAREVEREGLVCTRVGRGFVRLEVDTATAARLTLSLRTVSRVIWEVGTQLATTRDGLTAAVAALPWESLLPRQRSWRVRAGGRSQALTHTGFAAQVVADGIRDRFVRRRLEPPPVDLERPDILVDLHLGSGGAEVGLDLAARSLHARGTGRRAPAPLREDVAAGLAHLAGIGADRPIIDPFCGSGTLLAETLAVALGMPAGRRPRELALSRLPRFSSLDLEALVPAGPQTPAGTLGWGFDAEAGVIAQARRILTHYGLDEVARIRACAVDRLDVRALPTGPGWIVTNPPWGRRLGGDPSTLWRALGTLARRLPGWRLAVLSGDPALTRHLGLRADRRFPVRIGGVDTRWLLYSIHPGPSRKPSSASLR
ncbi:MAG: THUMP domain-containing protein [Acidobacteriota bacterium]|nr:THUMP domain-containing protein [Acidobacteriota bacterium]